ncbi:MAG: TetR/AcrR family transcriptional regulator [Myxococcota bacterium]
MRVTAPPRRRRSHAERTAETRGRVLAAVVACIAELGFQRTTGGEIARRAGVSWGAIQHHFGDKNGVLAAALEASFARFAEALGEPDATGSVSERVDTFVDRAWHHFRSDHYRTTFEILLNLPPELDARWAVGTLRTWSRIWQDFFPESRLSKRETTDLMHYATSVLSGLATANVLEGRSPQVAARSLAFLKDTLVRELQQR